MIIVTNCDYNIPLYLHSTEEVDTARNGSRLGVVAALGHAEPLHAHKDDIKDKQNLIKPEKRNYV